MRSVLSSLLCLAFATPVVAQTGRVARPVASLSDEFTDASSLARWRWHHAAEGWPDLVRRAVVQPGTEGGVLVLEPATSGWYEDWHAPFLFKEVTGDFDVTVRLKATGLATEIPTRTWSLTGLMVRRGSTLTPATWTPGHEDWLFITTGIGVDPGVSVIETKTTANSRSRLQLQPTCGGWIELRTVRTGGAFVLLSRCPGGEWLVRARFDRRDLPATVQVGVAAYTDWDTMEARYAHSGGAAEFNRQGIPDGRPDLRVLVDYVRFRVPAAAAVEGGKALTDPSVSDTEVIRRIGG